MMRVRLVSRTTIYRGRVIRLVREVPDLRLKPRGNLCTLRGVRDADVD